MQRERCRGAGSDPSSTQNCEMRDSISNLSWFGMKISALGKEMVFRHSRFSINTQGKTITRRSRVCSCRNTAGGPLRHDTGWTALCTSVRYTRSLLPHPVLDNGGKDWPPPLGRNHKVWNVSASPWQEVVMKSDNLCYRVPPVTWLGSRWIKIDREKTFIK